MDLDAELEVLRLQPVGPCVENDMQKALHGEKTTFP